MTSNEQAVYLTAYTRWLDRQGALARRVVLAQFGAWQTDVLASIDTRGLQTTIDSLDVLVSNQQHKTLLQRLYEPIVLDAATREYERLRPRQKDINPLDVITTLTPIARPLPVNASFFSAQWRGMLSYILSRSESTRRITQIATQTRVLIRDVLVRGAEQNWSLSQLSRNLAGVLAPRSANARRRATLIARTETTRAASMGAEMGAESTRLKLQKKWLATSDSRTRDPHRAMLSAKPVPKDGKFRVGGRLMSYPGDPAGGASQCINCRCSVVYLPIDD